MRNLNQIIIISIFFFSVFSCTKNKEISINKGNISAKWLVSETSNDYESFEFNKSGNYIVVENSSAKSTTNQIVYFGSYEIIDGTTLELTDFGTLKITLIDDENISFSLTLDGKKSKLTIDATKAEKIATSSKTELLCRTWDLVSVTSNVDEEYEFDWDITVLFSEAGTYFVTYNDTTEELGVAQWCWKNDSEKILCYSWEGEPTCDGESEVKILELTKDELQFSETFSDEELTYNLEPATTSKSKRINLVKTNNIKHFRSGFLKNK